MIVRAGLRATGIVVVVLALSGCTGLFAPGSKPAASTPSSPATAHGSASAVDSAPPELQRGDTVATGTLRSLVGDTTGSVRVEYMQPAEYKLVWEDFRSDRSDLSVGLVNEVPTSKCAAGTGIVVGQGLNNEPDQISLVGVLPSLMSDPSWLDAVQLTTRKLDQCGLTIVASATLTWTMPDQRPKLGDLTDHGATESAAGTTTFKSGIAVSYLVEYGDSMPGIAERFGTTVDDLEYLNPSRGADPTHYVDGGQRLNLSKAVR